MQPWRYRHASAYVSLANGRMVYPNPETARVIILLR
jgi:hypothetical protein